MWYLLVIFIVIQHSVIGAERGSAEPVKMSFDIELVKRLPVEIQNHIRFFVDGTCNESDEQFKKRVKEQKQSGWIPPDTLIMPLPINTAQKLFISREGLAFFYTDSRFTQLDKAENDNVFIDDFLKKGVVPRQPHCLRYPLLANTSANGNHISWLTGATDIVYAYQKPLYVGAYNCNTEKKRIFNCAPIIKKEGDFLRYTKNRAI